MRQYQRFRHPGGKWGAIALIGAAILKGILTAHPLMAQPSDPPVPTLTPADRALFLIQNEAAVGLNTYSGNINVIEFGSLRSDNQVIGYDAIVERSDNDQGQLACTIDLEETVICQLVGPESTTAAIVVDPTNGPCDRHHQETLLEQQFIRQDSQIVTTTADYAIRIYESIDDSTGERQVCMNVYNLRDNRLIGVIPVRSSTTATAYYSDAAPDGVNHQILLTQDNRYVYRQSRDEALLYEGYSR